MYIVDEATPLEVFFDLRGSVEGMSLAMYLAELMGTLAPEGEEAGAQLRLLLNSLALICRRRNLYQVKAVCELRALSHAGYMPDLVACAGCGCYEGDAFFFDVAQGAAALRRVRGKGRQGREPAGGRALRMRHILYSGDDKVFSFILPEEALRHLSGLCTDYVTRQLDHRFKSLDFLQTVLP